MRDSLGVKNDEGVGHAKAVNHVNLLFAFSVLGLQAMDNPLAECIPERYIQDIDIVLSPLLLSEDLIKLILLIWRIQ